MSSKPRRRGHATIEDFLAISEERRFHELIDGEIIEKATPSGEHGRVQGRTIGKLGPSFDRRPGGRHPGGWWFATEVEIRFGKEICRPDIVGWRRERVPEPPRGTP